MLAIRPPEYFPGLKYMALVQLVDCFVLADTLEYRRQSFQNRARLRNPQGWQWITVPLEAHQRGRPIHEVAINRNDPWKGKHWRAFQYNYRSTPYFEYFEPQVEPFFQREWTTLGGLTSTSVELLHELMGLSTELMRASKLDGAPDTVDSILEAVDEQALVTDPASADPASTERGTGAGTAHTFHFDAPTYHQNFEGFEPGMSTSDLLFNYGPEARSILADHTRTEPSHPAEQDAVD